MFCEKCGSMLEQGAKFCSKCGNAVAGKKQQELEQPDAVAIDGNEIEIEKEEGQELQQLDTTVISDNEAGSEDKGEQELQQSDTIAISGDEAEFESKGIDVYASKSKSKWVVVVALVAVVLFAGWMVKGHIMYAISPEFYVKNVFNDTVRGIKKDYFKMQTLLAGAKASNPNNLTNISFDIKNVSHTDEWEAQAMQVIKGLGIDLTAILDNKENEYYLTGKYRMKGKELLSLNARLDDNELLLGIPELFDGIVSVPSEGFGYKWNRSIFGKEIFYEFDDDLDISFSNLKNTLTSTKTDVETEKSYINALEVMFSNAHYEKAGNTNLMVGNTMKKCIKTKIVLKESDVKQGLMRLLDTVKSDNRIKDKANIYYKEFNNHYIEEAIEEIKYEIKEYFEADEIIINLFTNKDQIVKVDFRLVPDRDYKEEKLEIGMEFSGDKNYMDDFKLKILVDDEELIFESKGNHSANKNIFTSHSKFTILSYGSTELKLESSVEIDFNKSKDNLNGDIKLLVDDEYMDLRVEGSYNLSANSVSFESDDIAFSYKDYYGDIFKINIAADILKESGNIDKPNFGRYEKLKLFDMDEYELIRFFDSIEKNVFRVEQRIDGIVNDI